ncbi:MAG: GntR family transcriptional regulator [Proteobacteria bacterium]|nr:GntR family transcriptional regulator [Pseudomonadota bacterium]MBU1713089.1 GntR family transcriptional regulator [Pseudomonadota bacterium]
MRINIENINLRDQIYEILRDMILQREIGPGEKIGEEELSKKIGVSRTPFREALYRLEGEGIIEIIARRGAFVRRQSRATIIEVLEIREVLEGLVVRLVALNLSDKTLGQLQKCLDNIKDTPDEPSQLIKFTHADEEFHQLLLDACQNQMLKNLMATVNIHLQFIRLRTVVIPGRAKKTIREHYEILDAVAQKDASKAEALMRRHIASVREYATEHIENME